MNNNFLSKNFIAIGSLTILLTIFLAKPFYPIYLWVEQVKDRIHNN